MKQISLSLIFLILFFFLFSRMSFAQYNKWVMVSGSALPSDTGNFGAKGVPAASNIPPAKYEPGSWTDTSGNFWVWGGLLDSDDWSDLWKYDFSSGMWTWKHGSNTHSQPAVKGNIGIPNPANMPERSAVPITWTDKNNNLWMFGGITGQNGLWKYSISTNEWTLMQDLSPPVYGAKGTANALNFPGHLFETRMHWTDQNGNFWVYGGFAYAEYSNNLWKYDPLTNQWTWMSGDKGGFSLGVYGTKGISSPSNKPGARVLNDAVWLGEDTSLWLFGGSGINDVDTTGGSLNDLWKYKISTGQWTWMSGSKLYNSAGYSAGACIEDPANSPPADFEDPVAWTDNCGNLWRMNTGAGLWRYNVKTNQWAQINVTGVIPDARYGAVSTKYKNDFYMFGGSDLSVFWNQLWKYIPDKPTASFTFAACPSLSVNFVNNSTANCNVIKNYKWDFGDGQTDTSFNASHTYAAAGTYPVTLFVQSCTGIADTLTKSITVTASGASVNAGNDVQINYGDAVTLNASSASGTSYTWSPANGLSNANILNPTASPTVTTTYILTVTDANGCTSTDDVVVTVTPCTDEVFVPTAFSPNNDGINDVLYVYGNCFENLSLEIFNRWGNKVFETTDATKGWDGIFKGKESDAGIFIYSLRYEGHTKGDIVSKRGNLSLIK